MALNKGALIAKINAYITTNTTKDITAAKTREILNDILDTIDGSAFQSTTLDLGDNTIYNGQTRELLIPSGAPGQYYGIFHLFLTNYVAGTNYGQYAVVRSDGTDGGTLGLAYRSKVINNLGNALSDATKWEFADADGDNVGRVEILKISNFPSDHNIQLECHTSLAVELKIVATPIGSLAAGKIALDVNTSVIVTGIGFIILQLKSTYIRKVGGGLLQ